MFMFRLIFSGILLTALVCPLAAPRAQTMPDLSTCTTLSDPKAYEAKKISDGYFYIAPGKDGWLFRTKQDFVREFTLHPAMKQKFKAVQDTFAAKGIDIIFTLIPPRGIVAADQVIPGNPLAEGYDPKKAAENYAAALEDARSAGLNFIGITKYKGSDDFFFRTDHHWNASGARQMAAAVADFAKTLPSWPKISKTPFTSTEKNRESFESTFQEPIEDLCGVRLPDAVNTVFETAPAQAQDESALFGDTAGPEIVLVGTSNSNPDRFHPNFDGFLKEYLQADIMNAAITGGGLDDSILSWLAGEDYARHPPKLVIWEIPGYYTFLGETSQKSVFDQLVPSILGNCGNAALASSGTIALNGKQVPLFKGLRAKALQGKKPYFALEFSKPVKKPKFTLFLKNQAGKDVHKIKFKRSDRFPVDGSFFYTFQTSKIEDTDSVVIEVPNDLQGGTVEARICPGQ